MEETEVRESDAGKNSSGARWAMAAAVLGVATAMAVSAASGAGAQTPPIYTIPSPTPTATPTGTPFRNTSPPPPVTQPNTAPKFMNPFPVVRTAGTFTRTRTTFTRFTVKTPKGTKLDARCVRFGCTMRRTLRTTKTIHIRSLERTYKPGTKIRVRLTQAGLIGKYVSITTRRNRRPLRVD